MKITSCCLVRKSPESEISRDEYQVVWFFPPRVDSTNSLPLNSKVTTPGTKCVIVNLCEPASLPSASELPLLHVSVQGAATFTGCDSWFLVCIESFCVGKICGREMGGKEEGDVRLRLCRSLKAPAWGTPWFGQDGPDPPCVFNYVLLHRSMKQSNLIFLNFKFLFQCPRKQINSC